MQVGLALKRNNKVNNPLGHKLIKKLIALALLPPSKIEEALCMIKRGFEAHYGRDNASVIEMFRYFGDYWMDIVTPEHFSVYDEIDRTNNFCEVLNSLQLRRMGFKPHIKTFLSEFNIINI